MTSSILQDATAGRAIILPWTVDLYHRAIGEGWLEESTAFELLDGFIVRKDRSRAGEDLMTGTVVSCDTMGIGRIRADNGDNLRFFYWSVVQGFGQLKVGCRVEFPGSRSATQCSGSCRRTGLHR